MSTQRPSKVALVLRLYVVGSAPNSVRAIANIRAICDEHFSASHEIEIVDLLVDPQRAIGDGIIVTPTLLRLRPAPMRRLIGTLSDSGQVVETLAAR